MSKVISETGTLAELKAFADKLEQNGISFGELSRSATLREATMRDSLRGSSTVEHLPVKQGDAGSSPACAAIELIEPGPEWRAQQWPGEPLTFEQLERLSKSLGTVRR